MSSLQADLLHDDEFADRPLTQRVIAALLADKGPLSYEEIVEETAIPFSTVKDAVLDLKRDGYIESRPAPHRPKAKRHDLRR